MTHHHAGAAVGGHTLAGTSLWNADMAEVIATSHRRCQEHGLARSARPDYDPLSASALSALVDSNRLLHTHALPAMETLYQQIANTHNMVLLTDAQGVIVHSLGDADFLEKAHRVALMPGVAWSEATRGTNAIGTAIAERAPAIVHADQHYLAANHFLTCSAAPIMDHQGTVVGVLDVSGDRRSYHKHTMALVRMSALMIENQMFAASFENAVTVHFHARPEFVGTLMEGIASFTPGGRFLAANRNGLFQLGLPLAALQAHTFTSLFGLPLSSLYSHYRAATPGLLDLCLHNGVRVRARAVLQLNSLSYAAAQSHAPEHAPAPDSAPVAPRPPRTLSGLRYLNTGDARLAQVLDKVNKVLGRDVPILIMGETGTGKELLAQAIHQDSPRAAGAFVAVNCASIPEALIESELFGYEEGAFTGARRRGATGKIVQANGGTLFLDEIGDMPLSLQARLLRVLQERVVTPLGSNKHIPVNVELICATNQNLRQRIAQGLFREDLYYRLNGLVVKLPPLRERTDLDTVVRKILAAEGNGAKYWLSAEALDHFRRHSWPGNLRQLTSLLRTAIIMAGDEGEIGMQHLPDDFLDDLVDAPAVARTAVQHKEQVVSAAVSPAAPPAAAGRLDEVALDAIRQAVAVHAGNVSAAARALGISRNTVYRKLGRVN